MAGYAPVKRCIPGLIICKTTIAFLSFFIIIILERLQQSNPLFRVYNKEGEYLNWTEIYDRNVTMVYHICYPFFMNAADTEDAVQETFLRLIRAQKSFRDINHEKAWLITTARNVCRDELRRSRRKDVPLENAMECSVSDPEPDETLLAIAALPEKYAAVIYLYYYEGYSTASIAKILHRADATVRSDLRRGRALLKNRLGGI